MIALRRHVRRRCPPSGRGSQGVATIAEGYLESIDGGQMTGWAYDPERPGRRLFVEITAGGRSVTVLADRERGDLRSAGKGDGRHGFVATLDLLGSAVDAVRARIVPAGQELHGSPYPNDLVAQIARSPRLDDLRREVGQARRDLEDADASGLLR